MNNELIVAYILIVLSIIMIIIPAVFYIRYLIKGEISWADPKEVKEKIN